jgi:hypothetical protein
MKSQILHEGKVEVMFVSFDGAKSVWKEYVGRRCRLAKAERSRRNALVTPMMVFSRLFLRQSSGSFNALRDLKK